jgi:hypothetical protein
LVPAGLTALIDGVGAALSAVFAFFAVEWLAGAPSRVHARSASSIELQDFPVLAEVDIRACLAFAADRERRLTVAGAGG